MLVTSSNKYSEPHNFVYTPKSAFGAGALAMASTLASLHHAHTKSIQGILPVFICLFPNKQKPKEKKNLTLKQTPPTDAESQCNDQTAETKRLSSINQDKTFS